MIRFFRQSLNTWPVKLFFLVLVAAFGLWGIKDVVLNNNTGASAQYVARVGGQTISPQQFLSMFNNQEQQVAQKLGSDPTPQMKREIAAAVLGQLVTQAAMTTEAKRLGVAAPISAIRDAIAHEPAFAGPDGKYSADTARAVLDRNHLSEEQLETLIGDDVRNRQIVDAARAGAHAPDTLTGQVFAFQRETRAADMVELPFASVPPPAPTDAQLHRWYENHPSVYSTPEYRKVRVVVLSAETVGKDLPVSDADLHKAYDAQRATFVKPERRSAQVVQMPDQPKAQAIAAAWRAGADWTKIQADAKAAGGDAVELDRSAQGAFPGSALGAAVFGASVPPAGSGAVLDPIHDELGWRVVRVTQIIPATTQGFEQVRDMLRQAIVAQQAAGLVYDRANKLDNLLASGTKLSELPSDLGLAGMEGTMDAHGLTQAGAPAPIPGPPELRDAIAKAAFAAKPDQPPHLVTVPVGKSGAEDYYALNVLAVTPPAKKPYDVVADAVRADWTADARRHVQDGVAAGILEAVKGGRSIDDAAKAKGLTVLRTALTGRTGPAPGVPPSLVAPLFTLRKGEPTMVETPDSFVVAVAAEIDDPNPKSDPAGYAQMQSALTQAFGRDIVVALETAIRNRRPAEVNDKLLDQIVQR